LRQRKLLSKSYSRMSGPQAQPALLESKFHLLHSNRAMP
jgi:hypothetical protein